MQRGMLGDVAQALTEEMLELRKESRRGLDRARSHSGIILEEQ